MQHFYRRRKRLPACKNYPSLVASAGSAALAQLPDKDYAVIMRSVASIQNRVPRLGDELSLELITALGIFFAQKSEPAQVQAGPVRRV